MKTLWLIIFLSFIHQTMDAQCTHPDYDGLMDLYFSTGDDRWIIKDGWQEGSQGLSCDPCDFNGTTWAGIQCENGRVVKIDFDYDFLGSNDMVGTLPDLQLSELRFLKLENGYIGPLIPDFTGMPLLDTLILENHRFSEPVPDFSQIPNLKYLSLRSNEIFGPAPNFTNLPNLEFLNLRFNDLTEISENINFPLLTYLDISLNDLSGSFPNFKNLPNLNFLDASSNDYVGAFPLFENCPNIIGLDIRGNDLSGPLGDLKNFEKLETFDCRYNAFSGPLPDFASSPNMNEFLGSFNNFSGCFPDIACEIDFDARSNSGLAWYGDVTPFCNGESQVGAPCFSDTLDVGETIGMDCLCSINPCSEIHPDYDALMQIYDALDGDNWDQNNGWTYGSSNIRCNPCLDYADASWTGVHCQNNRVTCIDLDSNPDCTFLGSAGNNLRGEWPEGIELPFLETLILDNNFVSGSFPDLSKMPNIKEVYLSFNELNGVLPDLSKSENLETVRISFNNFEGDLQDILVPDSLKIFTISNNNFSGCYPEFICDLELFDSSYNPNLPWSGDHIPFCEGDTQVNAPCGIQDSISNFSIDENCICTEILSSTEKIFVDGYHFHPIPTHNKVYCSNSLSNTEITLFNSTGKLLKLNPILDNYLDLGAFPKGLYFLKIKMLDGNMITRKLIKN